jgi:hypothetical protein
MLLSTSVCQYLIAGPRSGKCCGRQKGSVYLRTQLHGGCWPDVTCIWVCVSRDCLTWKCYIWSRCVKILMPKVAIWRLSAGWLFGVVKRVHYIMKVKKWLLGVVSNYHSTFLARAREAILLLSVLQLLIQLSEGAGTCNKSLQILQRNKL